tara:strand:+ start:1005 stop:1583 length:579 start_codon:yes stop_codon:yes gene_type:complete
MRPFDAAWALLKSALDDKRRFQYLGTGGTRDIGFFERTNPVSGKVSKYPFYRSSGKNSGEPGSWKHFHGVTTHPEEVEYYAPNTGELNTTTPSKGWVIKPQLPGHGLTSMQYFEQADITKPERYGHRGIEDYSNWLNENIGDTKFNEQYMNAEQINQALIDSGALYMHNMARGVQQPPPPPQPGSLQAQGSQ